jgi:hypothetical protein
MSGWSALEGAHMAMCTAGEHVIKASISNVLLLRSSNSQGSSYQLVRLRRMQQAAQA